MTIDEAIKHAEKVAEKNEKNASWFWTKEGNPNYEKCVECAKEHRQIAGWLRELEYYKDRQDLINKNWQELIMYKDGIEKIKMRSQSYRERGETVLASGMEQALDILTEVNTDEDSD